MERREKLKRNVDLFIWYSTLREPLFWGPVLITYLVHVGGMTVPEIFFMESAVLALGAILEIPTGALADLIGRKKTIVLGCTLLAADSLLFCFVSKPLHAWIANICWMVGFALCSGADSALLYDSLAEANENGSLEREAKTKMGLAQSRRFLLFAFCTLPAGWLYGLHPRLPALLSVPSIAATLVIATFFTEPQAVQKYSMAQQWQIIRSGFATVFGKKHLLWIVALATLLNVVSKLWFFTYNPYFELVELPLYCYGYIFFALNIIAWFFSRFAYRIERFFGEARSIALMLGCVSIPIIAMGAFSHPAMSWLTLLQNVTRGLMMPFFFYFINQYVKSGNRATVGSIRAFCAEIGQFIGLLLFGTVLGSHSLELSLVLLGLFVLVAGSAMMAGYFRIFKKPS